MNTKRAGLKESEDGERKRSIFKRTVLCIFEGPRTKDQDHGRRLVIGVAGRDLIGSGPSVGANGWMPGGSLRGATVIGDVHQRYVVNN